MGKVQFQIKDGMMGIKWIHANNTHVASLKETLKIVKNNQLWSVKRCVAHDSIKQLDLTPEEFMQQLKDFVVNEGLTKEKV